MTAQRRSRLDGGLRPGQPAANLRLRLWLRLLRTSRGVEGELRERLRVSFGTTLPKFDVMAALDRRPGGITMTELSRFLMVSNGNVTGIVDRLAADGLVVRRPHAQDRRATFVRLTPKGARQFDAMASAHAKWVEEILVDLSDADAGTMIAMLGTVSLRSRKAPPALEQEEARHVR
jgi:DNA-binding MarR family transcriptional regulator